MILTRKYNTTIDYCNVRKLPTHDYSKNYLILILRFLVDILFFFYILNTFHLLIASEGWHSIFSSHTEKAN